MPRMSIVNNYTVESINKHETYDWLLNKDYLKRIPSISYCFGLYSDFLNGVITFGSSANYMFNNGKCIFNDYEVYTIELNRLCVDDELPKNVLSFFVSQSLKMLPKPCCIFSYADPNQNHHGYIYQATNWLYTGRSTGKTRYTFEDGSTFDLNRFGDNKGKIVKKEKMLPTHRYIYFHGSKKQKKQMHKALKMKLYDYPKGQNERYDSSYKPTTQTKLF